MRQDTALLPIARVELGYDTPVLPLQQVTLRDNDIKDWLESRNSSSQADI